MREIDRILALPDTDYTPTQAQIARVSRAHSLRGDSVRLLLPAQVALLQAVDHAMSTDPLPSGQPGVLGLLSCGAGKTLALQLAARSFRRPLLVLPRNLIGQMHAARRQFGGAFALPAVSETPDDATDLPDDVLYYTSYGKLSHMSAEGLLASLRPDAILFDEYHLLGAGARFRRVWKYVRAHRDTMAVGVTGTLTSRSVIDYFYACILALREWSPLPLNPGVLRQWASVLDADGEPSTDDLAAVAPLADVFADRDALRTAYQRRLTSCPGVVVAGSPVDADVSIRLARIDPERYASPEVRLALDALETSWVTPDGTELVDALEVWAARCTLRLGFWRLWPEEVRALPEFYEWREARRAWAGMAHWLVASGEFTSRGLVEAAAARRALSARAMVAWERWVTARRLMAPPAREVRWVDDGRTLDHLVADVPDADIIWYRSRAVADWARQRGRPVAAAADGPPTAGLSPAPAVSMAYARGWEGQAYHRALILEPPTTARGMEQLLSRHHRRGQTRDVTVTLVGDERDQARWLDDAQYVRATTGTTSRILIGDWTD